MDEEEEVGLEPNFKITGDADDDLLDDPLEPLDPIEETGFGFDEEDPDKDR